MELLLHMEGADTSTTFIDSSANSHSVVANGTAQIDDAQKKFGSTSCLLDGNSDYLTIADEATLEFGSSDFTVDCWLRFNNTTGDQVIFEKGHSAADKEILVYTSATQVTVAYSTNGTTFTNRTFSWSHTTNTWYHFAVVRNGSDLKVFIDGTQIGTTQVISGTLFNTGADFVIGGQPGIGAYLNGWIDEFHVVIGSAIWTSNFPAPSAAYADSITGASSSSSP